MRIKGTFETAGNFEVKKKGAWDARTRVKNYADLLTFTSAEYIENGHVVDVYDTDKSKRGSYICVDETQLALPASWEKIGGIEYYQRIAANDAGQKAFPTAFELSNVEENRLIITLSDSNGIGNMLVPGIAFTKNGNNIQLTDAVAATVSNGSLLTIHFTDLIFIDKATPGPVADSYAIQTEDSSDIENEDGSTTQYEY